MGVQCLTSRETQDRNKTGLLSVEKPGLTPDYCFSKKQEFSEKIFGLIRKRSGVQPGFLSMDVVRLFLKKNIHIFQSMIFNISNHTEYGNFPPRWIAEL